MAVKENKSNESTAESTADDNWDIEDGNDKEFAEVLESLGVTGPWQMRIFVTIFFVSFMHGSISVIWAVSGYEAEHRCFIPFCDHESNATFSGTAGEPKANFVNLGAIDECTFKSLKNLVEEPTAGPESCAFYVSEIERRSPDIVNKSCGASGGRLVYDQSVVTASVATEFDLACESRYIRSLVAALQQVGMSVGSVFFGWLADCTGRLKALVIGCVGSAVFGCLSALSDFGLVWYAIMRFLTGVCAMVRICCLGTFYTYNFQTKKHHLRGKFLWHEYPFK